MKIGIVGSRRRSSYKDKNLLSDKIDELWRDSGLRSNEITIVTGDCDVGGDNFARFEAILKGFKLDVKYKKDPETGEISKKPFNRCVKQLPYDYWTFVKICYARNEEIAKEDLDYLVCLVDPDRKGGTEKTIEYFKKYHEDWKEKLVLI